MNSPTRNTSRIRSALVPLPLSLAVLTSCVTETETDSGDVYQDTYTASSDYLVWRDTRSDAAKFETVLVDPLQFQLARTPASLDTQKLHRDAYAAAMRRGLGGKYPLLEAPGANTLHVDTIITDRVTVPKLQSLARRHGLAEDDEGRLVRPSLQVTLTDASTGEPVAAALSVRTRFAPLLGPQNEDTDFIWVYLPFAERLRRALDVARWDLLE